MDEGRHAEPAGVVLIVGVICFMLWAVLFAKPMRHAADVGDLGVRRSVALAVLNPLVKLSDTLHIDELNSLADSALGRNQAGDVEDLPPIIKPTGQPTSVPTGKNNPSPGTSPPVAAPVLHRPTKSDPLRVLIVGDSLAIGLGTAMASTLSKTGVFKVNMDARISTGLSRLDAFNWPAQIKFDMEKFRPDVVAIMLGANDPQSVVSANSSVHYGTKDWVNAYRQRVAYVMDEVTVTGRPLVWVGIPICESASFTALMQRQNNIYSSEAAKHPGVTFVSSWELFQNSAGHYSAYLPDSSGKQVLMRAPDGIHMSFAGYTRLSDYVFNTGMKPLWKKATTEPANQAPTSALGR
jgi:hypothetical protein